MEHKREITIGFSVLIVVSLVLFFYFNPVKPGDNGSGLSTVATTSIVYESGRIDFGAEKPSDFPTNIPVEQGAKMTQSYSLDYAGQKQLTIFFPSTKTIKQNYTLYADFLKNDGWVISNKYESTNISALYGKKENNDINITITKEQVGISVLKK